MLRNDVMEASVGAFDPLTVELMQVALSEAWRWVPKKKRTPALHANMAAKLLRAAADGERDPKRLKAVALGDSHVRAAALELQFPPN